MFCNIAIDCDFVSTTPCFLSVLLADQNKGPRPHELPLFIAIIGMVDDEQTKIGLTAQTPMFDSWNCIFNLFFRTN